VNQRFFFLGFMGCYSLDLVSFFFLGMAHEKETAKLVEGEEASSAVED
jgi:hypothetical protein